jgi:competence protein ComEA
MRKHLFIGLMVALQSFSSLAALEINQASETQLDSLKGIGPALSGRILQARSQAPFKDWKDLTQRVKGIGPTTAQQLSQQGLTVNGQAHTADRQP